MKEKNFAKLLSVFLGHFTRLPLTPKICRMVPKRNFLSKVLLSGLFISFSLLFDPFSPQIERMSKREMEKRPSTKRKVTLCNIATMNQTQTSKLTLFHKLELLPTVYFSLTNIKFPLICQGMNVLLSHSVSLMFVSWMCDRQARKEKWRFDIR